MGRSSRSFFSAPIGLPVITRNASLSLSSVFCAAIVCVFAFS